jgi:hypothetical protein
MKFAVEFVNTRTGKTKTVITELTPDQWWDALSSCPDLPPNPVVKMYALHNAVKRAPPGFIAMLGEVHLVH